MATMQCVLLPVLTMTRLIQHVVCRRQVHAAADLRRTMMLLLMLLVFSLSSFSSAAAECPTKCECNNTTVHCSRNKSSQKFDRIPDGIPPATTFLDLSGNNINIIEPNALAHMTELETLYLNKNDIGDLKNGAFPNLSKLRILYLYQNNIENIETKVFNNLTSLEILLLNYNNINKLDLEIFKGLTKLEILDLSGNKINVIEPNALTRLTKLKTLDLSGNNINVIESKYLTHLTGLKFLDLSGNKINVIEPNALTQLTEINVLVLNHNNISDLKNGSFANLSKLQRLRIDHNPFMCDCDILWLVNLLQTTNFSMVSPTCRFPVGMSGKPLIEITEGDLHCSSPDVIVEPEYKTLSVGEQLLLSCKAVGEPKPFITWVKDDINLELGQRVQVFPNNTLIISNVERTDSGHYKCVASNHLGRKSSEAVVNVNDIGTTKKVI